MNSIITGSHENPKKPAVTRDKGPRAWRERASSGQPKIQKRSFFVVDKLRSNSTSKEYVVRVGRKGSKRCGGKGGEKRIDWVIHVV